MPREYLNDAQVEIEIARLQASPYVKLAKKEEYIRNQRRQRLDQLRCLEKTGKALAAAGYTLEMLEDMEGELE